MRQLLGRSAPLLIAVLLVGGYAVAETSQVEHIFCVNKKSKAVTYGKDGKCPKGSDPIKVASQGPVGPAGPVGPMGPAGAKGDTPITSFNMILKDASGAPVEGLIGDGSVLRDGYYWGLNYSDGKFYPTGGLYHLYLNASCTGEWVYPIYGRYLIEEAKYDLEAMKTNSNIGVLYGIYSPEGRILNDAVYTIGANATLVDNRNYPEGGEIQYGNIKTKLYKYEATGGGRCVEDPNSVGFYVSGIERVNVKVPSQLPAPIKWSKP